jgi:hypothetical protein
MFLLPDISVSGHDMFSATVWDPILFIFAVWNFKLLTDKTAQYFNILTNGLSEIIDEPISVGLV